MTEIGTYSTKDKYPKQVTSLVSNMTSDIYSGQGFNTLKEVPRKSQH